MSTKTPNERFKSNQLISKIPYISYHSIYKATRVLKAIFKIYCPIYNISEGEFFEFYSVLIFIESLVYETDTEVENNQNNSSLLSQTSPWDSRKKIIESFLKEFNLEHPTILNQLENMGKFFDLESQLVTSEKITYEDVICASELRSTDGRILHCTLIQMAGKSYRPEVFDLMLPLEVIAEFNDDFYSYKKDVAAGHYNTYWMFERLYGEEAHHYLQAEIERYRNMFEDKIKQFPEQEQEIYSVRWSRFWERCSYLSSAELIRKTALGSI